MFCFVPEYVHPCDCTGAPPDESQCKEGFFWNSTVSLLGRTLVPAKYEEGEYAYHSGIEENGDEKRHSFQENHLIFCMSHPHLMVLGSSFLSGMKERLLSPDANSAISERPVPTLFVQTAIEVQGRSMKTLPASGSRSTRMKRTFHRRCWCEWLGTTQLRRIYRSSKGAHSYEKETLAPPAGSHRHLFTTFSEKVGGSLHCSSRPR